MVITALIKLKPTAIDLLCGLLINSKAKPVINGISISKIGIIISNKI